MIWAKKISFMVLCLSVFPLFGAPAEKPTGTQKSLQEISGKINRLLEGHPDPAAVLTTAAEAAAIAQEKSDPPREGLAASDSVDSADRHAATPSVTPALTPGNPDNPIITKLSPLLTQYRDALQAQTGEQVGFQSIVAILRAENDPASKEKQDAGKSDAGKNDPKKDSKLDKEIERLENALRNDPRFNPNGANGPQNKSGNGGGSGGSDGGGGGGGSSPSFPSSFGDNNQPQPQNDAIKQLANRINGNNNGFANFNSPTSSSKKDDDKKSNFSIEPSKNSKFDVPDFSSKPKSPIPNVQSAIQSSQNNGGPVEEGTPVSLMQKQNSNSNFSSKGSASSNGAGGGAGMGMGMMGGGGMMGQQASMASLGGSSNDFPFNITGESMEDESLSEDGPRYRAFQVPMNSLGISGGSDGVAGGEEGSGAKQLLAKNQPFLYSFSEEEEALRGVPGIFRSLSSGIKKTRIQNLCSNATSRSIGLCQKAGVKSYEK